MAASAHRMMLLEACAAAGIRWFLSTKSVLYISKQIVRMRTCHENGSIDLRLTLKSNCIHSPATN